MAEEIKIVLNEVIASPVELLADVEDNESNKSDKPVSISKLVSFKSIGRFEFGPSLWDRDVKPSGHMPMPTPMPKGKCENAGWWDWHLNHSDEKIKQRSQKMENWLDLNKNLDGTGELCCKIVKEFEEFKRIEPWGIGAEFIDEEVVNWLVDIGGPPGSFYEGGVFQGLLLIPPLFPMLPPRFYFLTSLFHPNISEDGEICTAYFETWNPCQPLWSFLVGVQGFLNECNTADPVDVNAAYVHDSNLMRYKEIIRDIIAESRSSADSDGSTFVLTEIVTSMPKLAVRQNSFSATAVAESV